LCSFFSVAVLLIQDLHHSRLLVRILDQHASSAAHIFDHINDFAEAGGGTAGLGEAREAEIGALAVFEYDVKLDDKGDRLDLQV
jgi:hypothetical protein